MGQTSYDGNDAKLNGLKVGVTPSALINIYPAIQINATYGWDNKFQIETEIGYLHLTEPTATNGLRFRIMGKYYINSPDLYIAIGMHQRYTSSEIESDFSRAGGAYFEAISYKRNRKVIGLPIMIGTTVIGHGKLSLDVGFGLGPGYMTVTEEGIPDDAINLSSGEWNFNSYNEVGKHRFPIVIAHFKVQYLL